MVDESLDDLKKRLELISKIRQQVNLIHNVYENKRILGKSNFQKVHSTKKGESSRDFIVLGNGAEYLPPIDALKKQHKLNKSARNIIQDYDDRLLPSVIRKPTNFFPYNKYDFVGKRQEFVRTATGQSTDIIPYVAPFRQYDEPFYGPTQDGATGYEAHYTAERLNREKQDRKENRYRYARLQASRRKDERERLYNQAPWMKSLVQSGIIDKKFIPKIAKGVDKLSALKSGKGNAVVKAIYKADSAIRLYNRFRKQHLDAKAEDQAIRDSAIFGGNKAYSMLGFGLGMSEIDSVKSFQKLQARFGPATMEVLKAYGESMKDAPGWVRQNLAGEWGLSGNDANIAMFLGGGKEFTKAHAHGASEVGRAKHLRDMRKSDWFGAVLAEGIEKSPIIGAMYDSVQMSDGELGRIQERVNKVILESQNEASRPTPTPSPTNISGDNNVSSNISTPINITVYGNADAEEIASVTANSVTKAISRRANIDYISQGVLG